MAVVTLQGGGGVGHTASVTNEGHVLADVEEIQRVVEAVEVQRINEPVAVSGVEDPVTTLPGVVTVSPANGTASNGTSGTALSSDSTRRGLAIQVLGAYPVHVHFGDDDATTDDWRIPAGGVFSFPSGIAVTSAVQLIAAGGDSDYRILEYKIT